MKFNCLPSLLVFQAEVFAREHFQTGSQQNHLDWNDAQLAGLGTSRMAFESNHVTALDLVVQINERVLVFVIFEISHYLQLNILSFDVVEHKLVSILSLAVYTT